MSKIKKKIILGMIILLVTSIYFIFTSISNAADVVETWDISKDDEISHVIATLYNDGIFVISGTGNMASYRYDNIPYYEKKDNIEKVIIENGVTNIGDEVFEGCTNLLEIIIPEGITNIGNAAFKNCTNLTKMVIPNSVTSIGEQCFFECDNLVIYTNSDYVTNYANENNINCEIDTTAPIIIIEKNPTTWTKERLILIFKVMDEESRGKRSINK